MSGNSTIVRFTLDELNDRFAKGDIRTSDNVPEAEPLPEGFWDNGQVRMPGEGFSERLVIDNDVIEWFRAGGKGHVSRINSALREYIAAHKKAS